MMRILCLLLSIATLNLIVAILPAKANCSEQIATSEVIRNAVKRRFEELQKQQIYPWGKIRPYDKISGNNIILTSAFDQLTGIQKKQVISEVLLYNLTEEERNAGVYIGIPPHSVYASDGRIVSYVYDGCTSFTPLTEKERYSAYLNDFSNKRLNIEEESRNILPSSGITARKIRFPITARKEKKIRLLFWKTIGYSQEKNGWWIAWVPEHGYFEINLPHNYNKKLLEKFLGIAPRQYRYVLVDDDGTFL